MGQLFGTDGIRGIANRGLDAQLAFKVGQAAAIVLSEGKSGKALFTIGKDTRISSDMLEASLIAGVCAAGGDIMPLGVIPTPAVAYITIDCGADAGIVISASHNPYEHNGIKIFNSKGFKLSDELEKKIEDLILSDEPMPMKCNGEIGRVVSGGHTEVEKYIEHLRRSVNGEIKGLKVLIDCSNGAASSTAATLFSSFPIEIELIKDHPNGVNINDNCGSTHTGFLRNAVVNGEFDIGIAFDGDADRCIIVDEKGNEIDGDKIMGVCGKYMKAHGKLSGNTIVATVMSNIGFHKFAETNNINLVCTTVGDRNVLEKMLECGYSIGGEQSGHIIFLDNSTTGDGQLAAVKFLEILSESGKTVSQLVEEIPQYPQVLINVPVTGGNPVKNAIMAGNELKEAIQAEEKILGTSGRVLVRPSGTESLIRVMVESSTNEKAEAAANRLVEVVNKLASNHLMQNI